MEAIVTGATGFLGSHFIELLNDNGFKITVPIRSGSNTKYLPPDINTVVASMTELDPLIPYIERADYIFHFAGVTRAMDNASVFKINIDATMALANIAASKSKNLKRFVFISSQAASMPSLEPICEDALCQPISIYGKSKRKAEVRLLSEFPDLPITIIRPPSVFGERDKDIFFYFKLAHSGILPLLGDPNRKISLIHVHDLVRGIYHAAKLPPNQIFYISNYPPISWNDFADELREVINDITGKKPLKIRIPFFFVKLISFFNKIFSLITRKPALLSTDKVREMQCQWICNPSKIVSTGFKIEKSLKDGLRDTYKWYLDNNWLK